MAKRVGLEPASAASEMRFCPSRQASWTLPAISRHGRVRIVASGRESGAATERAISSSSTSATPTYPSRSSSLTLLAGEMSSSLATLQHLRYLDLSCNDFNGTSIPVFLSSLKNLRYLNLSSWILHGCHVSLC
uniref:Uncharacterized protein n=1 Tax=Aegilops tauschii subsp. strangulata TaxID=200361 RepID=A0A453Q3V3_AEGTS